MHLVAKVMVAYGLQTSRGVVGLEGSPGLESLKHCLQKCIEATAQLYRQVYGKTENHLKSIP